MSGKLCTLACICVCVLSGRLNNNHYYDGMHCGLWKKIHLKFIEKTQSSMAKLIAIIMGEKRVQSEKIIICKHFQ